MVSIELKKAVREVSSFAEFFPIVKAAKEKISFFGGRYVHAEGYKGSVDIDAFAIKVFKLLEDNYEFTEEDRVSGREIVPLIDRIYKDNYKKKLSNLITRICCALRDFLRCLGILFEGLFGKQGDILLCWKYGSTRNAFNLYTYSQYQKVFGQPPLKKPSLKKSNCPDRWYGKKVKIES